MTDSLQAKDYAFLKSVVEMGGEATTSEIRQFSEESSTLVSISNADVNYRCKRMGSGTDVVNGRGWVRIEDNGLDGSNRPAPKSVILVDDEARSLVEGYTAESDMTGFDSVEEAFAHLLEQVEGQESRLDSVEAALDEERAEREDIVEEFKEAIETVRSEIPARQ